MKKVFLDDLPRKGKNKGCYDWQKSIGRKIKGVYENIEFEVEIVSVERNKYTLLTLKYNNKLFKINSDNFKSCRLGNVLKIRTPDFKIEIGTRIKDEKRDITIIDKEYRRDDKNRRYKWYKYHCYQCGYEGWVVENALLGQSVGCSVCTGHTVVEGINDIPTTAPFMIKYFQGGYDEAKLYTCCSHSKIHPVCPDCGRIKKKSMNISKIYTRKTCNCSCSDKQPYPQKLMFSVLEQLNISFDTEKKFDWCKYIDFKSNKLKQGYYDFYFQLNDKKYIIETDGNFHTTNNSMNGQTKEESKYIDDEKDRLALEHGIEVIRVDCDISDLEYIKKNAIIKLKILFNLNEINWLKAEDFALSNRVKEACEYWHNGINSTKEIAKVMKLHQATASRYLKKGSSLLWCDYNSKNEMRKNGARNGRASGNSIICITNNQVFSSGYDCSRKSLNLYGIQLSHQMLYYACKNKSSYKGFIFKYIVDLTPEEYIKYDIENKLKELVQAS